MELLCYSDATKHLGFPLPFRRRFFHHHSGHHRRHQLLSFRLRLTLPAISLSSSPSPPTDPQRLQIPHDLHSETLKTLEWDRVCRHLSAFASTAMARSAALTAAVPVGRTREESQRLLDQTTAALALPEPLDFSGIDDVSAIVDSAVCGEVLTIRQLSVVRRTLTAAWKVKEQLKLVSSNSDSPDRFYPLLQILQDCNFCQELVQHVEYCVDCNLSVVLDRASNKLQTIRSNRKKSMEMLDSLLNVISYRILEAGGIDSPLVTKRRSRMCVGIRASHRSLLPGGVVLAASSSRVTYFMEPKEAMDLNNKEVRLASSQRDEELAILSLLSAEIAESASDIRCLLDKVQEVDLTVARAGYAQWLSGVCPVISSVCCEGMLSVDIDQMKHPLLLASALCSLPDNLTSSLGILQKQERQIGPTDYDGLSNWKPTFPVPVDIKVKGGTNVVVISGPNAGGKTASMKTLGLASLMAKAGMYLPAAGKPTLPWFDLILADIGDHQSLEENLSTFSGHMFWIRTMLEVASKDSLVLMDEIGSGTDPLEGVALSTSILQYLKDRVGLAVVTTHYSDLCRLRDEDPGFANAAMGFCLDTLRPSYQILWGCTGESNALRIARNVGFDVKVIERAEQWLERLVPEKQEERRGMLYQSLLEERKRLSLEANRAASLHSEVLNLYDEIQDEAEDLGLREKALLESETLAVQEELKTAKLRLENIIQDFENQLKTADAKQLSDLVKKADEGIDSIVRDHRYDGDVDIDEGVKSFYIPRVGDVVHVKRLGDRIATVVEVSEDDETVLVQSGKVRIRVDKNSIRSTKERDSAGGSLPRLKKQPQTLRSLKDIGGKREEGSYGAVVQTSKNTVDLRGMRVEEASHVLSMEISAREPHSVMYIIHGMGSGVLKERVLEMLRNHRRVERFEQENPMNYGCTVAFIK